MSAYEENLRNMAQIHLLSDMTADMFRHIMIRIPVNERGEVIDPRNWTVSECAHMKDALCESLAFFQEQWRARRALCAEMGVGQFNHTDDVIRPRPTS